MKKDKHKQKATKKWKLKNSIPLKSSTAESGSLQNIVKEDEDDQFKKRAIYNNSHRFDDQEQTENEGGDKDKKEEVDVETEELASLIREHNSSNFDYKNVFVLNDDKMFDEKASLDDVIVLRPDELAKNLSVLPITDRTGLEDWEIVDYEVLSDSSNISTAKSSSQSKSDSPKVFKDLYVPSKESVTYGNQQIKPMETPTTENNRENDSNSKGASSTVSQKKKPSTAAQKSTAKTEKVSPSAIKKSKIEQNEEWLDDLLG